METRSHQKKASMGDEGGTRPSRSKLGSNLISNNPNSNSNCSNSNSNHRKSNSNNNPNSKRARTSSSSSSATLPSPLPLPFLPAELCWKGVETGKEIPALAAEEGAEGNSDVHGFLKQIGANFGQMNPQSENQINWINQSENQSKNQINQSENRSKNQINQNESQINQSKNQINPSENQTNQSKNQTDQSENQSNQNNRSNQSNQSGNQRTQSENLKQILSVLRAEGDETRKLDALTRLCELLSISTQYSLSGFSVESFVPLLVIHLNYESNADIMLLSARALTHLCDVLPTSLSAVVRAGAVPSFCTRLLTFEYIDLAEQSLQALEKISHDYPYVCVRAGALVAVLSYIDFFPTGVQRVAVSTAANICRLLPLDASDFAIQAVPMLMNLLQHTDSKVVEHASVCFLRMVESFASSPEMLDKLCSYGLIDQAARLISISASTDGTAPQPSLSNTAYTGLIHLLSICARASVAAAKSLHCIGIGSILKDILIGSALVSSISVSPAVNRSADQLNEIVTLVNELLPPMPEEVSPPNGATLSRSTATRHSLATAADVSSHEMLLQKQPDLLLNFGMALFPVLIQVYSSSVNTMIRQKCLAAISKLVHFSDSKMLSHILLKDLNMSSFLAGVLACKDPLAVEIALRMAEMLMQKLPAVFTKLFVKEGVVYAVDALISSSEQGMPPPIQAPSSSSSSRTRRGARRQSSSETVQVDLKAMVPPSGGSSSEASVGSVHSKKEEQMSVAIFRAKHFKETYFPADSEIVNVGITESLSKLKMLCTQINGYVAESSKRKHKGKSETEQSESQMLAVVAEILGELGKGDGVSTFEFIGSGVIGSLLNYLLFGYQSKEKMTSSKSDCLRQQALKRFKHFIELTLPCHAEHGTEMPMKTLVCKLQYALSSEERFPVILSQVPLKGTSNSNLTAGLSALARPLRLRFCRERGEKNLYNYHPSIALIDPLTRVASIEEFLWPHVQCESVQKSLVEGNISTATDTSPSLSTVSPPMERRSTRSSRLGVVVAAVSGKDSDGSKDVSPSKGKGKIGTQAAKEVRKGPVTRKAAAQRQASATNVAFSKQSLGVSALILESKDKVIEAVPIEYDEAIDMEEYTFSDDEDEGDEEQLIFNEELTSMCEGERVHDIFLEGMDSSGTATTSSSGPTVKSGQASRFTGINPGGRSLQVGALEMASFWNNTFSFSSTAMSGLASGSRKSLISAGDEHSFAALNNSPKLSLFLDGKPLNRSQTILQAVQQQVVTNAEVDEEERYAVGGKRGWAVVHTITYRQADPIPKKIAACSSDKTCRESLEETSFLDNLLQGELPLDLEKSNVTYNILLLLRLLEGLNRLVPRLCTQLKYEAIAEGRSELNKALIDISATVVPQEEFLSNKLTPKLGRQMKDALMLCGGGLPAWCSQLTRSCPFLFPFETRRQYFNLTAFGETRAFQRLQQQELADNPAPSATASNEREVRVGRLQRQKVRVFRSRILESAAKVMEMYSGNKSVLEVEYFDEVGTGLGPTLEFYTLLSHELQRRSLNIWRGFAIGSSGNEEQRDIEMLDIELENIENTNVRIEASLQNEDFVHAPYGLFPRPWSPVQDSSTDENYRKVLDNFRLLGRTVAKALQDGRFLDLPLSTAFFKLMLGQEIDLFDISTFDPQLGHTLQEMYGMVHQKKLMEFSSPDGKYSTSSLLFRDAKIEDLCLDFTLPGYPDYLLKPGGNKIGVTLDNLEEYILLVVDTTVKSGISAQMKAFRSGFNQVFQLPTLQIFREDELDYLLRGRLELWMPETLAECIKFDHGYTSSSPPVKYLLEVMGEFTPSQQRLFLQFVTGSPCLPPGGLAALNPKLTIVRKHPTGLNGAPLTPNGATGTTAADGDLPSVMTCANYLKLPPYSCKEVMRKRLLYAVSEGQGSFDLS